MLISENAKQWAGRIKQTDQSEENLMVRAN